MTNLVEIIKNDHQGNEVWRYGGEIMKRSEKGLVAEAFFNRRDLEFNGVFLKEKDRFLELYLVKKWFNIYEIFDRDDGQLKAWYCNVTRPVRIMGENLYYDDLALDLIVYPNGRQLVLDEDEFKELKLNDGDTQQARSALEYLQQLFMDNHPLDIYDLL